MLGLGLLKNAIARLARALEGLAQTAEAINTDVRARMDLDADTTSPVLSARVASLPAGEPEESEANGQPEPVAGKKGGRKS